MKRFRNYCLFFLFIVTAPTLFAQEKGQQIREAGRIKSFANVNLLSSLNELNPRLGAGFVYDINERWKLGVDLGYGNKQIDIFGSMGEKYRLWEVRPELYYFISPWKQHERYFSAELFYINHYDVFLYNRYYLGLSKGVMFDQADYQRYKSGVHLKYGMIFQIAKHLGLNFYTGFGLRIRSNSYSNVINPVTVDMNLRERIDGYKEIEGIKTGVDFSLGLKLVIF